MESMNGKVLVASALATGCLAGCSRDNLDGGEEFSLEACHRGALVCVRIENASAVDFDSFDVHFPNEVISYGSVAAGKISEYREVSGAYRYAYTEASAGERHFVLQPIDYIGETFVPNGAYTYRYDVNALDEPVTGNDWIVHGYMSVSMTLDSESSP